MGRLATHVSLNSSCESWIAGKYTGLKDIFNRKVENVGKADAIELGISTLQSLVADAKLVESSDTFVAAVGVVVGLVASASAFLEIDPLELRKVNTDLAANASIEPENTGFLIDAVKALRGKL